MAELFNESSKGVLLHTYLFPLHLGPFAFLAGANCLEYTGYDTATLAHAAMH